MAPTPEYLAVVIELLEEDAWDAYVAGEPRAYTHTPFAGEQAGDREKCERAWLAAYDLAEREANLAEQASHHDPSLDYPF